MKTKKFRFEIEATIAEVWIEDGFKPNKATCERMAEAIRERLFAYALPHEAAIKVRRVRPVLPPPFVPTPEDIAEAEAIGATANPNAPAALRRKGERILRKAEVKAAEDRARKASKAVSEAVAKGLPKAAKEARLRDHFHALAALERARAKAKGGKR